MRQDAAFARYGLAALVTAVASLISIGLRAQLVHGPLSLFVLAVAVSAWYGGLGPGLLTIVLSAIAIDGIFYGQNLAPSLIFPVPIVPLVEFVLIASAIVALTDLLRNSRERASENLARLDAVLATAPVGLAFVDRDLRYRQVNRALAEIQGILVSAYVGRSVGEMPRLTELLSEPSLRRVLATGEPVLNEEGTAESPKGRVAVLVSRYPVRTTSGRLLGVGVVVLDITARKQAEEARDRIANQLQLLLASAGEGIYGVDTRGRCTFVNPAAAGMLGYKPEDLLGRNMHEAIHYRHPDGSPYAEAECPIFQAFRTGKGVRVDDEVFWRRGGVAFPVEYASFPIVERGIVEGAVVTFTDITERKEATQARDRLIREQAARILMENERARLQAIIEQTPSGMIYVDQATGHILTNRAVTELFGRPLVADLGINQFVGLVFHPNGQPYTVEELLLNRALHGETVSRLEVRVLRPSGQRIPVQVNTVPVCDAQGRIIGAVGTFEDVSEQRERERQREEWVSVIAHDLRQPVQVIIGYADLLARQIGPIAPALLPRIEHIRASAHQLNRLVNDLLDISRIEAHRLTLKFRATNLVTLVRDVVERMAEVTKGNLVRIEVQGEIPVVNLDPARIEQVLMNLLSNAAKYGTPGAEILVTIGRSDGGVSVAVTNRGPGIAAAELPKLFSRFYRTQSAVGRKVPGVGLGLYISRELVEAHGGRISVESTPGETTTFRFTLPLAGHPEVSASQ